MLPPTYGSQVMGFMRLLKVSPGPGFILGHYANHTPRSPVPPTFCWPSERFQGILGKRQPPPAAVPVSIMPDLNIFVSKTGLTKADLRKTDLTNTDLTNTDRALLADSPKRTPQDPKQRSLMIGSLCLLLLALGIVLWHDRDFWFPDTPEADSDQPVESSPVAKIAAATPHAAPAKPLTSAKSKSGSKPQPKHPVVVAAVTSAPSTSPPAVATATRTVLPPLDVEVVAGDSHSTIRPGSSPGRVHMQPGTPQQPVPQTAPADTRAAGNVTTYAAERVQMSADA